MPRARALSIAVLLLSYGAVGARQPAVRAALPLPAPAPVVGAAAFLPSSDPSTLLLHIVRVLYGPGVGPASEEEARRAAIRTALGKRDGKTADVVPLPLDPVIWRETILQQAVPDRELVAAILNDRRAALLYHGLAALDDETLAWLGPDRETLLHVRQHAALFATFGRSIHVRGGRVLVPGGADAEPLWAALTGVDPGRPAAFVQRIFRDDDGKLAFLYDAVAHLDGPRQRFALGLHLPASSRDDRLRALLDAFTDGRWQPSIHPFSRPLLDASLLLSTIAVRDDGEAAGPMARRIWERVFHDDATPDVPFSPVEPGDAARDGDSAPIDAAWLAARISRVPYTLGRRRLDTVLFAQRVFAGEQAADSEAAATALRGFASFPALMLTLERLGATGASTFERAAHYAAALGAMDSPGLRRTAVAGYQSALGIVERAHRAGVLTGASALALANGLALLEVSPEYGYEERLAGWLRTELLRALPSTGSRTRPAEASVLAAMAGIRPAAEPATLVEWEGARYRVDPAGAELRRLWRVRERQGGLSLDGALAAVDDRNGEARNPRGGSEAGRMLADTLTSILYAAHLGDPDGPAVTSSNVALRHDLALPATPAAVSQAPWQLPAEEFIGKSGWRVRGSLLGLDSALARLALRRLDPAAAHAAPKISTEQRHIVALAVALLNPSLASNRSRDEIAAALARGAARAAALTADPAGLDKAARAAGLSEWRRQALAWTIQRDPRTIVSSFSLPELFWLGSPRPPAIQPPGAWGAAALPLTGCLCMQMPAARAWEEKAGRPGTGLLAADGVDVSLLVAAALASLQLPAALAPAILSFAAQDVLDRAQPAYPDDWSEFSRAARAISRDRLMAYVAALTANGPLVGVAPVPATSR
jgi:hypothetical protein